MRQTGVDFLAACQVIGAIGAKMAVGRAAGVERTGIEQTLAVSDDQVKEAAKRLRCGWSKWLQFCLEIVKRQGGDGKGRQSGQGGRGPPFDHEQPLARLHRQRDRCMRQPSDLAQRLPLQHVNAADVFAGDKDMLFVHRDVSGAARKSGGQRAGDGQRGQSPRVKRKDALLGVEHIDRPIGCHLPGAERRQGGEAWLCLGSPCGGQ